MRRPLLAVLLVMAPLVMTASTLDAGRASAQIIGPTTTTTPPSTTTTVPELTTTTLGLTTTTLATTSTAGPGSTTTVHRSTTSTSRRPTSTKPPQTASTFVPPEGNGNATTSTVPFVGIHKPGTRHLPLLVALSLGGIATAILIMAAQFVATRPATARTKR